MKIPYIEISVAPIIDQFIKHGKTELIGKFKASFSRCPNEIPIQVWELAMENLLGETDRCAIQIENKWYSWKLTSAPHKSILR